MVWKEEARNAISRAFAMQLNARTKKGEANEDAEDKDDDNADSRRSGVSPTLASHGAVKQHASGEEQDS